MLPLVRIDHPVTRRNGVQLSMLRLDLLHPEFGGNKWFKLKYNIAQMKKEGKKTLLTYGGAHSNHIAAVAAAGKEFGFRSIGIIRGEELHPLSNPTLKRAAENGMELHFISRDLYKRKHTEAEREKLKAQFGDVYFVPEGGANELATKGCGEILLYIQEDFDFIVCACGTGSTLAGIIPHLRKNQMAIGIPVLADALFLEEDIKKLLPAGSDLSRQWKLYHDYSFGRYGSVTKELIRFVKDIREDTGIPLDYIYTAKMLFATLDLIDKGVFLKGEKVIALHTGGLQGNQRIEEENLKR